MEKMLFTNRCIDLRLAVHVDLLETPAFTYLIVGPDQKAKVVS